jgi:hypothetical protein
MDPLSLLCRLAAAVHAPKFHVVRYAGVLTSAHHLRSFVVPPLADEEKIESAHAHASDNERSPTHRCAYQPWAELMKCSFAIEVEKCDHCGARLSLRALVTAAASIDRGMGPESTTPRRSRIWVFAWGLNTRGLLHPLNFDSSVLCWGENNHGELGLGEDAGLADVSIPGPVRALPTDSSQSAAAKTTSARSRAKIASRSSVMPRRTWSGDGTAALIRVPERNWPGPTRPVFPANGSEDHSPRTARFRSREPRGGRSTGLRRDRE